MKRWIVFSLLVIIILLINYKVFERFNVASYFIFRGKYLLPTEWALLLFLYLIGVTFYRIFTSKIFNDDPKTIKGLITKYRREKK